MSGFSASASALGYMYQCRYALLGSLRRVRISPDLITRLECRDDVSFENMSTPDEMLQLKHHTTPASLTDGSADLWKTLRVWIETPGILDADGPLFLLTTGAAPKDGAASLLCDAGRDVQAADAKLIAFAKSSTSESLEKALSAYRNLDLERRLGLLDRVTVIDNQLSANDLEVELRQEVRLTVSNAFIDAFLTRLEGWWFRKCLAHLADPVCNQLSGEDLLNYIDELRDQLREDNLPIDEEALYGEPSEEALKAVFVRQLGLINVGGRRVDRAVRDYMRAFAQKSRWQRDALLRIGELERYEQRLTEEWDLRFAEMREDLGDDAAEEEMIAAARQLYRWVEQECDVRIRPHCTEAFVIRGSYHELAEKKTVGWHPDFEARLIALLEPAVAR